MTKVIVHGEIVTTWGEEEGGEGRRGEDGKERGGEYSPEGLTSKVYMVYAEIRSQTIRSQVGFILSYISELLS